MAFEEQPDLEPHTRAALAPFLPSFRFLLDDLVREPDAALRARALSALARLTLLVLKHARGEGDLLDRMAGWIELLRQVAFSPTAEEDLTRLLEYVLRVAARMSVEKLEAFFRSQLGPREEAFVTTAGERLQQEANLNLVLRQLRAKFGELAPEQEERVRRASFAELDRCALELIHAEELEEVLPYPPNEVSGER